MKGITRSVGNLSGAFNSQAKQLTGMRTQILGVVGAYASAAGAAKAFNATIGAAARFEASEVAIEAIFNDKKLSDSYLKMVDKMAIDSPLLNSTEMLASSKGLVAMTKNVGELGKSWKIIEKLQVLDPTQGTDGAAFALKEMFQGDAISMVQRFGLNKKELNRIKKLAIPQQIAEINSMLDKMGVTEAAINKMGSTTMGYWAQIGERTEKFMRAIGAMGNSKIGAVLGDMVAQFDKLDMDAIASKVDAVIGGGIQKVIDFAKAAWEMRAPIIATAKAVGTFVGVVAGIVAVIGAFNAIGAAVGFLTSPIGLLALAIIGISKAFKLAYAQSEPFRKVVDGIVGAVKALFAALGGDDVKAMQIMEKAGLNPDQMRKVYAFADGIKGAVNLIKKYVGGLFAAFKTGDTGGILSALGFSPNAVAGIMAFITTVKTKVGEFVTYLKAKWEAIKPGVMSLLTSFASLKDTAISIFTTLWAALQPVFSAVKNAFMIVADIAVLAFNNLIVPTVKYMISVFQMWWKILGPILKLIGSAIGLAFEVLKIVWDTILKPVANFLMTVFKKALEGLQPVIEKIGGAFEFFGGIIEKIAGWFDTFKSALSAFKVPSWLSKLGGGGTVKFEASEAVSAPGATRGPGRKSHYHGIDYIPYNGYQATLHKGEKIVTAQDNKGGQSGGGVHIAKLADSIVIREEADIEKFAYRLAQMIESEGGQMA